MALHIETRIVRLTKRYPLRISRGTSTGSQNLFVFVSRDGLTGVGEAAPGTGHSDETFASECASQLGAIAPMIAECASIHDSWALGREHLNAPALAALDTALWDLHAKEARMPLHRLLGLSNSMVPTSVTIGINPVEVIRERVPEILSRTGAKALKIKLGSMDGIEEDQAHYIAAQDSARPFGVKLRVDANGGWTVADAQRMMTWLAEHECDYVEQPLAKGMEGDLPRLFENRRLPIFADESCHFASDVPGLANCVDGINLKLMKCGGITEAIRIVATARAQGLQTMIGCMGESSIAISAAAALGSLFDHIDLDSHLNLSPDPACGLGMAGGVLVLNEKPGHGAELTS